jgi:hypothetical protein
MPPAPACVVQARIAEVKRGRRAARPTRVRVLHQARLTDATLEMAKFDRRSHHAI